MAANQVEKKAVRLHKYLQECGKFFDKSWRQRIRKLLAETYEAMNAKPLDGKRCLAASDQIDIELAMLDQMSFDEMQTVSVKKSSDKAKSSSSRRKSAQRKGKEGKTSEKSEVLIDILPNVQSTANAEDSMFGAQDAYQDVVGSGAREIVPTDMSELELSSNAQGNLPEGLPCEPTVTVAVSSDAVAGDAGTCDESSSRCDAATLSRDDSIGLFDLIHIEIRCLIKIRAVVRPPFIGKFVMFAEEFAQKRESRIEAFIAVLSPSTDELSNKMEIEVGYEDDLIPNMPGFDLVLHPKKKRR